MIQRQARRRFILPVLGAVIALSALSGESCLDSLLPPAAQVNPFPDTVSFEVTNHLPTSQTGIAEHQVIWTTPMPTESNPNPPSYATHVLAARADLVVCEYRPQITIHAPSDEIASEYEVGIVLNLMPGGLRSASYENHVSVNAAYDADLPLRDGAPESEATGCGDAVFQHDCASRRPWAMQGFERNGQTVQLELQDSPSFAACDQLSDQIKYAQITCTPEPCESALEMLYLRDLFRTWIAVRHKPTGNVKALRHFDYEIRMELYVQTGSITVDAIDVSSVGYGEPGFVRGGPTPNEVSRKVCNAPPDVPTPPDCCVSGCAYICHPGQEWTRLDHPWDTRCCTTANGVEVCHAPGFLVCSYCDE